MRLMGIEGLLLTKDEIPIIRETSFYLPIHPMLLDKGLNLDPEIAFRLFPQAVKEWHEELSRHTETLPAGQTKTWYQEVFLKGGLRIAEEKGFPRFRLPFGWGSEAYADERGFAQTLSVTRNSGSIYFNVTDDQCGWAIFEDSIPGVRFAPEKLKGFSHKNRVYDGRRLFSLHIYAKHNVDHFPAALLLRNWGILYLNEAMKQAAPQKKV